MQAAGPHWNKKVILLIWPGWKQKKKKQLGLEERILVAISCNAEIISYQLIIISAHLELSVIRDKVWKAIVYAALGQWEGHAEHNSMVAAPNCADSVKKDKCQYFKFSSECNIATESEMFLWFS